MFWKSFFLAFLLDNKKYLYNHSNCGRKKRNVIPQHVFIFNSANLNDPIVNNASELINKLWKKSSDGYDHRFNNTEEIDSTLLAKLVENNYKMNVLKFLTNKDISTNTKLLHIDEYKNSIHSKINGIDIKAGGLFKDWDNI
jgi:hypothetical protein